MDNLTKIILVFLVSFILLNYSCEKKISENFNPEYNEDLPTLFNKPFDKCKKDIKSEDYCKYLDKSILEGEYYHSYDSNTYDENEALNHCRKYHRECKLLKKPGTRKIIITNIFGKEETPFNKCLKTGQFKKEYCNRFNQQGLDGEKFHWYSTDKKGQELLEQCRKYHRECKLVPNDDEMVTAIYGKNVKEKEKIVSEQRETENRAETPKKKKRSKSKRNRRKIRKRKKRCLKKGGKWKRGKCRYI